MLTNDEMDLIREERLDIILNAAEIATVFWKPLIILSYVLSIKRLGAPTLEKASFF